MKGNKNSCKFLFIDKKTNLRLTDEKKHQKLGTPPCTMGQFFDIQGGIYSQSIFRVL